MLDCSIKAGTEVIRSATQLHPKFVHIFDRDSALAVRAALAARRPLLVRGAPGTGKSQLAKAVALQLGWCLVSEVVHSRTEPQSLLWRYDAVARLGDAQALGAGSERLTQEQVKVRLANRQYLSPGPLWWAFEPRSAHDQYLVAGQRGLRPEFLPDRFETDNVDPKGAVLLIDEIDKAESDVPNALLEALANASFPVPWRDNLVRASADIPALVIVTSNEDRELPAAFVRRCLVLNLGLPKDRQSFIEHLSHRAVAHFGEGCLGAAAKGIYDKAAEMLWADRDVARRAQTPKPGQAEYLDLLRAVHEFVQNAEEAHQCLDELRQFTLGKHRRMDDA